METRTAGPNEVLISSPISDEMMSMLLYNTAIYLCIMLISIILTNKLIKRIDNIIIKTLISFIIAIIISLLLHEYTNLFQKIT